MEYWEDEMMLTNLSLQWDSCQVKKFNISAIGI